MCKTFRTQNFRAPRLSQYSFGDICRPFRPSHLKSHEFHFFTIIPTKPSSYTVLHRQPWRCAKPSELKTFVHQDFHSTHLGTFVGLSNPHISKTTNFIFSRNSPPSHLLMLWSTPHLPWERKQMETSSDAESSIARHENNFPQYPRD